MKVRLSGEARTYIRTEAAYLRSHSRAAAETFLARMSEALKTLEHFPEIGLGRDSLPITNSRRLIAGDYLLDYEASDNGLTIFSIRHGRQRPLAPEAGEDFDYEGDPRNS